MLECTLFVFFVSYMLRSCLIYAAKKTMQFAAAKIKTSKKINNNNNNSNQNK